MYKRLHECVRSSAYPSERARVRSFVRLFVFKLSVFFVCCFVFLLLLSPLCPPREPGESTKMVTRTSFATTRPRTRLRCTASTSSASNSDRGRKSRAEAVVAGKTVKKPANEAAAAVAAAVVLAAGAAGADLRLPPIDKDPNRCVDVCLCVFVPGNECRLHAFYQFAASAEIVEQLSPLDATCMYLAHRRW